MKGVSPIIATLLMLVIAIALATMAYTFFTGVWTAKAKMISLMGADCAGGTLRVTVRNEGDTNITAAEQTWVNISITGCTFPTLITIPARSPIVYNFTGTCLSGTQRGRLVGPGNSIEFVATC